MVVGKCPPRPVAHAETIGRARGGQGFGCYSLHKRPAQEQTRPPWSCKAGFLGTGRVALPHTAGHGGHVQRRVDASGRLQERWFMHRSLSATCPAAVNPPSAAVGIVGGVVARPAVCPLHLRALALRVAASCGLGLGSRRVVEDHSCGAASRLWQSLRSRKSPHPSCPQTSGQRERASGACR
jgi:hypothetical protein